LKFAETTIDSNSKVYLDKNLKMALNVEIGDVLEWHITNQTVSVKKREEGR